MIQGDVFRLTSAPMEVYVLCVLEGGPSMGGGFVAVRLSDGVELQISRFDEGKIIWRCDEDGSSNFEVATSVWYEPIKSPEDDASNRPYGVPFSMDLEGTGTELMMFVSRYRIFTIEGIYMNWKMLYWPDILRDGQWYAMRAEFEVACAIG